MAKRCEGNPEERQRREKQQEADRIVDWRQTCGELQFSSRAKRFEEKMTRRNYQKHPEVWNPLKRSLRS